MARRTSSTLRKTGPASCGECGARIVFVKMTYTGGKVPVDPIPVETGNVSARLIGNHLHGYVISKDHPHGRPNTRYAAHFGTCPDRPQPKAKPEAAATLFDVP